MPTQFPAVKAVLDNIIVNWTSGNGIAPDLQGQHNSVGDPAPFGWSTRDELLASHARGIPLIQPSLIGVVGQGSQVNLVVALTVGVGIFPPMPDGGLDSANGMFLTLDSPEIQTIISWVEDGCLA